MIYLLIDISINKANVIRYTCKLRYDAKMFMSVLT